jgi:predicted transcriptional regulator
MNKTKEEPSNEMYGKAKRYTEARLRQIMKDNPTFTPSSVGRESKVNYQIVTRIINGEDYKVTTLDLIWKWIYEKGL